MEERTASRPRFGSLELRLLTLLARLQELETRLRAAEPIERPVLEVSREALRSELACLSRQIR